MDGFCDETRQTANCQGPHLKWPRIITMLFVQAYLHSLERPQGKIVSNTMYKPGDVYTSSPASYASLTKQGTLTISPSPFHQLARFGITWQVLAALFGLLCTKMTPTDKLITLQNPRHKNMLCAAAAHNNKTSKPEPSKHRSRDETQYSSQALVSQPPVEHRHRQPSAFQQPSRHHGSSSRSKDPLVNLLHVAALIHPRIPLLQWGQLPPPQALHPHQLTAPV